MLLSLLGLRCRLLLSSLRWRGLLGLGRVARLPLWDRRLGSWLWRILRLRVLLRLRNGLLLVLGLRGLGSSRLRRVLGLRSILGLGLRHRRFGVKRGTQR